MRGLLTASLILGFLLLPGAVRAQEEGSPAPDADASEAGPWRVLSAAAGDTVAMDARNLQRAVEGVYRVWIRETVGSGTRQTPEGEPYDSSLRMEDFDCESGRSRVLERFYLRSGGKVVGSVSTPESRAAWIAHAAESPEGSVTRSVCEYLHKR